VSHQVASWARDTEELAPIIQEADPGLFEHRAMLAFRALAAIYLAGIVLAFFPEPRTVSLLLILTFNGAAFLLAMAYLLIARSLRVLQPWAVAVARPVLVLVLVEDLVSIAMSIVEGRLRGLPVATALAGWALLGAPGVKPIPWPKLLSGLALLLVAPLLATLVFTKQVFGWGGALDVRPSDLTSVVVASCGAPGDNAGTAAGEPPASIRLTYDWSWTKGSPVPSGLDIVVIGWTGDDAAGRPLYLLGPSIPTGRGIHDGRRLYPSLEMGNAIAAASRGSWQWGIELGEQGLRPGRIEVELERAREAAPGSEPLRIMASYVHLGLWHEDVSLTCEW
jgi:hypothetical protein